ncbi:hypothetical protein [Adhaeribacter aquaticus]|uniref:hypothetical protein n=1 Tax=Adhaeribacter aquaticus TaxID=299567 RepID=UPI00047E2564|nr:hypothetical protein [Adhaeribacter aquaticus]
MRKILLLFFFIFFSYAANAQDIIIKKNGDEIQAKVLEIEVNVVKYKRFDNLTGPTISVLKNELFMIKYENGTKETFSKTQPPVGITEQPAVQETIKLNGPRVGFTIIGGDLATRLKDEFNVNPFITQFGWQFETRLFTTSNGTSGLFEFVPLIGGLEQGKFLPSLNGLIGLRGPKGFEAGLGPNISLAGVGFAFAVGATFQSSNINFPVNLAFVPARDGTRVGLTFGFNSRRN